MSETCEYQIERSLMSEGIITLSLSGMYLLQWRKRIQPNVNRDIIHTEVILYPGPEAIIHKETKPYSSYRRIALLHISGEFTS